MGLCLNKVAVSPELIIASPNPILIRLSVNKETTFSHFSGALDFVSEGGVAVAQDQNAFGVIKKEGSGSAFPAAERSAIHNGPQMASPVGNADAAILLNQFYVMP